MAAVLVCPDDPVLFWLDDAFGETQFNSDLTAEWQRAVPSVKTAIAGGLVVPYAPLVVDQR